MNEDQFKSKWESMKGSIREHFARLSDDDVQEVQGKRENLSAKLQEKYGDTKEAADKKIKEWERRF
jgi:uncharacterized protein YjbJ (UPF0337 family)